MPSTHLSLHYHLIFSTKDRVPSISPEWRERLHAYMGGIVKNLGGVPKIVGGVADHVHLLVGLPATHALSDFMLDLKSFSSKWVREEIHHPKFAWQEGYGAFTVSPSQIEALVSYISNQEEHHLTRGFQEEYVRFLKKCGVEYDDRFLW